MKTFAKLLSVAATVIAVCGFVLYFSTTILIAVMERGTTTTSSFGIVSGVMLGVGALLGFASVIIGYKADKAKA